MAKKKSPEQLLKILEQNYQAWMKYDGVHYIDVGYKYKYGVMTDEVCFRFHVYNKLPDFFLKENVIPAELEKVPTDIIISEPKKSHRFGRGYNELRGGIEIRNANLPASGTLGCVFRDAGNHLVGLSNHHVLFSEYGQVGQYVIQPSIQHVTEHYVIGRIHTEGKPEFDAAIFALNITRRSFPYEILDNASAINTTIIARLGMPVKKSGIATELTYGIVDGIGPHYNFSYSFNHANMPPNNILIAPGDSGSAVLLDNGMQNTIVGLNYLADGGLGRGRAFDIAKVMQELGLRFI
jgi:hypothetical protein